MKEFRFLDEIPVLVGFSPPGKFFLDLLANFADHGPVSF
jgi:hypothetical protein